MKFATAFKVALQVLSKNGNGLVEQSAFETLSSVNPIDLRVVSVDILDAVRALATGTATRQQGDAVAKWAAEELTIQNEHLTTGNFIGVLTALGLFTVGLLIWGATH